MNLKKVPMCVCVLCIFIFYLLQCPSYVVSMFFGVASAVNYSPSGSIYKQLIHTYTRRYADVYIGKMRIGSTSNTRNNKQQIKKTTHTLTYKLWSSIYVIKEKLVYIHAQVYAKAGYILLNYIHYTLLTTYRYI